MEIYHTKNKLLSDEKVLGGFLSLNSPSLVEMVGYSGFDFIVIDNEHGAFSNSDIVELIRACKVSNLTPIVRTVNDKDFIQKVLDSGAQGIQVPMVNNKEQAETVVKNCLFNPEGNRGVSYSIPAAKYGLYKGKDYLNYTNEKLLINIQIETLESINNIQEILKVERIDIVFIGLTDLANNLQLSSDDIKFKRKVDNLIEEIKKSGKKIGIVANNANSAKKYLLQEVDYVVVVINTLINESLKNVIEQKNEEKC
ncbi:hypothetical protein BUY85_07475 [Staphylococcus equorum]|uniref:HpcH/HpaI aldolase family protein n=5 Tax=Staphylococcus equorum TaxID=246432 RepID=UPI000D1C4FA6|nr:aldolase/citrate lyase family protein [Staphylococcus equorum]PTE79374.1 hypothetical protein BUY85_07475 [Staphylococcus equorum]